jgi:hypothetical protein
MHCPKCKRKVISLPQWLNGLNAFDWRCEPCNIGLTAGKSTWISFGIAIAVALLLVLVPLGIVSYFLSSYERKK